MNTGVKLSAYGMALVVVFAGAWSAGNAVGPLGAGTPSDAVDHQGGHATDHAEPGDKTAVPATPAPPEPPPRQQPTEAAPTVAVAQPQRDSRVAHPAVDSEEPAAVSVTIAPSSAGSAERLRWTALTVQPKAGSRRQDNTDGVTRRDRGHEHRHNHHEVRGRGQR
ncbi:hypothetical protein [Amycolatopsis saalfeldensis]|uniref:hypothetical protein n=1 Tax=Amycolatopsis saalfeldensis TaxID=394193 RepID=UPI0011601D21|nr:hypothetical protein [Amycolatopsis saalfeldensis]